MVKKPIFGVVHVLAVGIFCLARTLPVPALVLAENGEPRAQIVINQNAREGEKLAAEELATYLGKMSGASFEVSTQPGGGPTIFVGSMEQTRQIVEELRARKAPADSFVIRCKGDRLYLVGSDYDMAAHERPDEGTCNAVYTLLDEFGCRWYFPGELGEIVPKRGKLQLAEQDRYVKPSFWYRGNIWDGYDQWKRRNRGGGLDRIFSGHSYMQLVPPSQYEKEHPEYYAVIDSRRWPGIGLCTSNPEVAKIAIETAKEALRKSGRKLIVVSPPDTPWLCECDKCRALDPPQFRRSLTRKQEKAMYGGYAAGNSQGRSDRLVHFANAVARGIRGEFPDAKVLVLAYWGYMQAPVKYKPEPNVVCWYTLWSTTGVRAAFAYSQPGNEKAQKIFLDNAKLYQDMMLYAYYGHWSLLSYYPIAEQIAVDLPWFAKHGVGGFYSETHPNWITQGLNFYTMYRVSWDVNIDTEKMFDDYYRDLFGPAAVQMRQFDSIFRNAYLSHPNALREGTTYVFDFDAYTEEVLRSARLTFNRARKKAAGYERILQRLDRFEKGLEVTEIWCRAYRDYQTAGRIGSAVLARRARASFSRLQTLLETPGYAEGLAVSYWQRKLDKAIKRAEEVISELESDTHGSDR